MLGQPLPSERAVCALARDRPQNRFRRHGAQQAFMCAIDDAEQPDGGGAAAVHRTDRGDGVFPVDFKAGAAALPQQERPQPFEAPKGADRGHGADAPGDLAKAQFAILFGERFTRAMV
jgi:hypothetical protein